MSPEQVYNKWRETLKSPADSIFYQHPSLERILLGLSIFVLTPQPALSKLGKAEALTLLHYQVPDLVTAWIDNDEEGFEMLFNMVVTLSETLLLTAPNLEEHYPSRRKAIREVLTFFSGAVACGGDMAPSQADELLDDLSTNGKKIYSEKIKSFGLKLLALTRKYGLDVPMTRLTELNGW